MGNLEQDKTSDSEAACDSSAVKIDAAGESGFWETVKARLRRVADKVCATQFVKKGAAMVKSAVDWLPKYFFPEKIVEALPGKKNGKSALKLAILLCLASTLCTDLKSSLLDLAGIAFVLFCIYYSLVAIRHCPFAVRNVFFATLALLIGGMLVSALWEARAEIKFAFGGRQWNSGGTLDEDGDVFVPAEELDAFDKSMKSFEGVVNGAWNEVNDSAREVWDGIDEDTKREINEAVQELNDIFDD